QATARVIARQPRISEQTLSQPDLPRVDRRRLGNGSDRLLGESPVRYRRVVKRLQWSGRDLQATQNHHRDCATIASPQATPARGKKPADTNPTMVLGIGISGAQIVPRSIWRA